MTQSRESWEQKAAPIQPQPEFVRSFGGSAVQFGLSDSHEDGANVLFVTGPHASGKSASIRYVYGDQQQGIYDLGPMIRQAHKDEDPSMAFINWLMKKEMQFGPDFTNRLLVNTIQTAQADAEQADLILIGSRSVRGVEYLSDGLAARKQKIIYIDACFDVLYERYKSREGMQDLTEDQFKRILEAEIDMGLHDLKDKADHVIDSTDHTFDTLKSELTTILNDW